MKWKSGKVEKCEIVAVSIVIGVTNESFNKTVKKIDTGFCIKPFLTRICTLEIFFHCQREKKSNYKNYLDYARLCNYSAMTSPFLYHTFIFKHQLKLSVKKMREPSITSNWTSFDYYRFLSFLIDT